ncbi:MAG: hypothetical protein GWN01_01315 [Nitrosopumilaceae archaeon]|nr:hypothetical protein [Nitrosopumilaceae archaeon]NIU85998.1 hypothetical protein [Nitrosopumilaceae archaeon]NIX60217.1 hypothetical protein [Nitrosopumilaceae archaeon]
MARSPEYCTVKNVADWLRIDINKNTDPNTAMVEEMIMENEDHIDQETGHSWRTDKQYAKDTFDVSEVYDYGHGMYLPLKHRNMVLPWDTAKGDKFEIWDGIRWNEFSINTPVSDDVLINFEEKKGILYIRGYIYTILRKNRFRITYRYGGSSEHVGTVPKDIKRACKLLTSIDILSTDFAMSQIAYGGEGNVDKQKIMDRWQKRIDKIIWNHSEILGVY